eukprot:4661993-Pyramimonas_sp.AAC.1
MCIRDSNASDYGSPADRTRWWAVVFDIHPRSGEAVKTMFHTLLSSMKMQKSDPGDFLLSDAALATQCRSLVPQQRDLAHRPASKKAKVDTSNWKTSHEQAFSEFGAEWP